MNSIIKSEKEARNLFLNGFCGNTHHLNLTYSQEVIDSYHKFSSRELEKKWRKEHFAELISQIKPNQKFSYTYFLTAMEYWCNYEYPIEEFLNKFEVITNHHQIGQSSASKIILYALRMAAFAKINKDDLSEEQAVISLYLQCCNLIDKYDILTYANQNNFAQAVIEEAQDYKYKILGVNDEAEAECYFRTSYFGKPKFQTRSAHNSYINIATVELEKQWMQNYINKQLSLNTANKDFKLYQCVELFQKGLANADNLWKLYKKLESYKTTLQNDNYINVAHYISRDILPMTYSINDYKLMEKYILLSEELVSNSEIDSFNYSKEIISNNEKYREMLIN